MTGRRLRVVEGAGGLVGAEAVGRRDDGPARCAPDPGVFQQECIDAFVGSQVAQGFSQITIENGTGVLERFLALADKPAWEITEHDVDRVIAVLVKRGVSQTTRRGYVQAFRGFFGFLEARKAVEIEALFGCGLRDPLDRFNSARHVSSETPGLVPPPTVERVDVFFEFLRGRLESARKWAPAARDYTLFRTLYHAGLRAQEAAALEIRDVHFNRGPFGKLHVRLGKGARGSGPRPRWVPMLDRLDDLLRWYLADARPRFRQKGPVLFCDESGGVMAFGTIRNRLAYLQQLEGAPVEERFSPHALRRACATRNYERGVDLVAIQQMPLACRHDNALCAAVLYVRRGRVCARDLRHAVRARARGGVRRWRCAGSCGWLPRSVRSGPERSCGGCCPSAPGWDCHKVCVRQERMEPHAFNTREEVFTRASLL